MDILQLVKAAGRLFNNAELYPLLKWFMAVLVVTTLLFLYQNRQVWELLILAARRYRPGEKGTRYYKTEGQVMPDNTGGLHYNLYFNKTAVDLRYCKVFGQYQNGNNHVLIKTKQGAVKVVLFESEEFCSSFFNLYSGYFKMTGVLSTGVYLVWVIL